MAGRSHAGRSYSCAAEFGDRSVLAPERWAADRGARRAYARLAGVHGARGICRTPVQSRIRGGAGGATAGWAGGGGRASADLADWPNVGHFDVVVDVHRGVQIRHAFELKWCKRKDKLNEALWDAAKLALAVAVGRTEHGSLLYAGPVGLAASSGVGALLFTGGHFELAELIHRYPAWWDWPVKTRPTRLPQTVSTIPAGAVAWRMRTGAAWEARLLNVLPDPAGPRCATGGRRRRYPRSREPCGLRAASWVRRPVRRGRGRLHRPGGWRDRLFSRKAIARSAPARTALSRPTR